MKALKLRVGCEFIAGGEHYKVLNSYDNGGGRAKNVKTGEVIFFSVEDTEYFAFYQ